jgi:hypothetical protein
VGEPVIAELGSFIAREQVAATPALPAAAAPAVSPGGDGKPARVAAANGSSIG